MPLDRRLICSHVVLTTYDMITSADFRVFKSIPRWETVCVDEGQRREFIHCIPSTQLIPVKSDSNLIFKRLKSLNSVHRILLTGTPLNNNLRELFNLLNFLDPDEFTSAKLLRCIVSFPDPTVRWMSSKHDSRTSMKHSCKSCTT